MNENLEILTGDIRNSLDVSGATRNVDYVIHLAAQISVQKSINNPQDSFENNVAGLINVLDAVRLSDKIKKIILDPVMVATSGDILVKDKVIEAIKTKLVPIAEIVKDFVSFIIFPNSLKLCLAIFVRLDASKFQLIGIATRIR